MASFSARTTSAAATLLALVLVLSIQSVCCVNPVLISPELPAVGSLDASSSATSYALFNLSLPASAVSGVIALNALFTYTQIGSANFNLTVTAPNNALVAYASVNDTASTASLAFKPTSSGVFSINASLAAGSADFTLGVTLSCQSSKYSAPLSFSCNACPANSVTPTTSFNVSDCTCDIGYYSADGRPTCLTCPEGASCSSIGTTQPTPVTGYYYVSSNYPGIGKCRVAFACLGGSLANTCAAGYTGRLCGECASGYYKLGLQCEKCFNGRAALAIAVILFLVAAPIIMYLFTFMYMQLNTFPAIVDYMQIIALIGTFTVAWPSRLLAVFNDLSFILFNWQLSQPECGVDDYSWYWRFGFTLAMPIILAFDFAFVGIVSNLIRYMLRSCLKKKAAQEEDKGELKDEADGSQITTAATALCSFKTMTFTRFANFSLAAFFTFCEILYLPLTYMAFSLYSCTSTAGITYLDASPSIECWSGSHNSAQPVAILALIVYSFGIPFAQFVFGLVKSKQGFLYGDFHTVIRTGALFRRYAPKRWWWPVVAYLRRLLVTLPAIFLVDYPTYQTIATLVILNGYLLAELIAKPYARKLGNFADTILIISQYLLLFFGLAYSSSELDSDAEYVICMVIIFGALVFGFLLLGVEIGWTYKVSFLGIKNSEPQLYFMSLPAKRDMAYLSRLDSTLSKAVVVSNFVSPDRAHLTVMEGNQVTVVNKADGGDMWTVEFEGRRGLVPSANLEEVSS